MTGYAVVSKTGRVVGGETDTVWYPRVPRSGKRGVILCHGAGHPQQFLETASPNCVQVAGALAQAGIACVSGAFGGDNYANDASQTAVAAAWSLLQTECGVASDKVLFLGTSMGAATAIRYAQANPTKVAGIVGAIPGVDLSDIYVNDRSSLRAPIGTAWGVTYPTPLPTRALLSDPANEALITGVPMQLYYSSGDTLVLPATVTAFAAATGAAATVVSSAAHGDAVLAGITLADVVAFMYANGA